MTPTFHQTKIQIDGLGTTTHSIGCSHTMQEEEKAPTSHKFNRKKHHSTKRSLAPWIQLRLFTDIENAGGLFTANLHDICENDPHHYGAPKSKQRRQVRNKVYKWKQLSAEERAKLPGNLRRLVHQNESAHCVGLHEEQGQPSITELDQQSHPSTSNTLSNQPTIPTTTEQEDNMSTNKPSATAGPMPYGSTDFSDCRKYKYLAGCCVF